MGYGTSNDAWKALGLGSKSDGAWTACGTFAAHSLIPHWVSIFPSQGEKVMAVLCGGGGGGRGGCGGSIVVVTVVRMEMIAEVVLAKEATLKSLTSRSPCSTGRIPDRYSTA